MATKPATTEKFDVRSRWTNAVQFTAEISCAPDASVSVKLGLAIRWAVKSRAYLSGAYLSGAYLSGADLSGADLSGADLSGADLSGADLSGADLSGADLSGADLSRAYLSGADLSGADLSDEQLRPFKADLFLTLSSLHAGPLDALHLIAKLNAGEVDGDTYGHSVKTECACLVGTIAQTVDADVADLDRNSDRPAERWFMMIKPGGVPGELGEDGKETGRGYAARKALEWVRDWCVCHGINPDKPAPKARVRKAKVK